MPQKHDLKGRRVAILVAEGFEQVEMTEPRRALQEAGAVAEIVSPEKGLVQAFRHHDKGDKFHVDVSLDMANPADYDALMLPGGVANPDALRIIPKAVSFVKAFFVEDKPVAAICHAPWALMEDVVDGHTVTSWPSLQTDLENAGANWIDRVIVVDDQVVTSCKPDDLPVFNETMLEIFERTSQEAAR